MRGSEEVSVAEVQIALRRGVNICVELVFLVAVVRVVAVIEVVTVAIVIAVTGGRAGGEGVEGGGENYGVVVAVLVLL